MLALTPILPGAAAGVVRVVAGLHSGKGTNDIALGAGIKVLGGLEGAEEALRKEPSLSLVVLIERWGWSESVMSGLENLQQ